MKKTYTKPKIVFDSFELSQSIATGCAMITMQAYGSCPSLVPGWGMTVYTDGVCDLTPTPGSIVACYQTNQLPDNQVFSS